MTAGAKGWKYAATAHSAPGMILRQQSRCGLHAEVYRHPAQGLSSPETAWGGWNYSRTGCSSERAVRMT